MERISAEVLEAVRKKYPDGWSNHVKRITKPNGEFFHGITVDMDSTSYLIKVPVKVDSKSDLEKEEEKEDRYGDDHDTKQSDDDAVEPSEDPEY